MALDKYSLNKLFKMMNRPHCPVCNGVCCASDANELEYIKTRRGTEIFIHTECMKKRSE